MNVQFSIDIDDLPQECIDDCSSAGDVTEAVEYWQRRLNLTVNRERAEEVMRLSGGWDGEQIDGWSDEEIAQRVLWMACGTFREFQTCVARGYVPADVPSGSEVFYLGM